ncbi:PREDICTED: uncharacterized protein LOC105814157 [Propithecus coquereli]|uniref:uncharacterized protein LOC105814157 n=1 Tax=Propithecus coquereli TaxID=379532 RepID=UPI00063F1811|nr:PREDICTED: uncharacterized protein LOC105814157 [Propithecus coquereli]
MRLVTEVTVFLTLGTIIAAKTTQPNSMDCAEGGAVNMPCNHSTISGNEYIHWYRQNPSQSPQYIINGLKNNVTNDMASLTITADRKSSTLTLPHVTLRDAGMYYCILRVAQQDRWGCTCAVSSAAKLGQGIDVAGRTGAQSVAQPDVHVTVSEGDPLKLRCTYSGGVVTSYLFWYIRYPGQSLQFLLKYTSGDTLVKGMKGFEAELRKNESSFHLKKHSARLSDSAQYFCAVSDTVPGAAGGAEHKPPETLGFSETRHSLPCL